jgi:hypothetical protein
MRAKLAAASAAALLVAAPAGLAFANGGIAMAVDVSNSRQAISSRDHDSCTWTVTSDVTVVNLTSQDQTITAVGFSVSWTSADSSGVQSNVDELSSGGLAPGVTLAPNERRTFSPVEVEFDIPCRADSGDLAIRVTSGLGTGSGDAPFLSGGTPVPPAAVGLSILAALVGMRWLALGRGRPRLTPAHITIDQDRSE